MPQGQREGARGQQLYVRAGRERAQSRVVAPRDTPLCAQPCQPLAVLHLSACQSITQQSPFVVVICVSLITNVVQASFEILLSILSFLLYELVIILRL